MTIKDVEQQTGLPRSVVRFYEKEGLIAPQRNAENRYRDYTQADVDRLIRIAFLRTLEIPIEDIRRVIAGETTIGEVAGVRYKALCDKEKELERARLICERLESDALERFDELDVSRYTGDPEHYVKGYRSVLLQDCVRFARWFGSDTCWMVLVMAGTLMASILFPRLPERIPVQWNAGEITGTAPRGAIFAYPMMMLVIRLLLRGRITLLCRMCFGPYADTVSAHAVNGLCFLALCLEAFSLAYLYADAGSAAAVVVFAGAFVLLLLVVSLWGSRTKK